MSAKFRIIFLTGLFLLSSVCQGADDSSFKEAHPPLWYQLQQREARADQIGGKIFLGVTAFSFIATFVFSYFFDALKKN